MTHTSSRRALAALAVLLPLVTTGSSCSPDTKPATPAANRLQGESSPYLLMHAHNPVNWYPWGEEAFEKARRHRKPIFLSIGYSSCYWCHVMERESFMDEEVAAYMNAHFVCIKVDREERPDVDDLYMTALQAYYQLTGSAQGGGWPLSMFLTPEGEPFFGGTYFPPRGKLGPKGFLDVLEFVHEKWTNEPAMLQRDADTLVRAVRTMHSVAEGELDAELNDKPVSATLSALRNDFDAEHGGFGYSATNPRQPKFPEPANLMFLLGVAQSDREDARDAQQMLVATLEKLAQGGIWDHLAGGFHRYSTDRYWAVPHFEKMLYDNGLLASIYSEAYALVGREDFARVARQILDFVLAEMTAPEGGFYSAIDAETDAEEGKFYVWSDEELNSVLKPAERSLLDAVYGTGDPPVFEGRHVLLLRRPLGEVASARGELAQELWTSLAPVRQKLLARRNQRKRPLTDTKILTAWNGLMIRGFADAGRILDEPRYTAAAAKAAEFILEELRTDDGRLLRSYAGGKPRLNGYLDDYAFLVDGLLALWSATGDMHWLDEADRLTQKEIELFWDAGQGGFYFTSHDHEELFARSKQMADGALPAGNSVSAENLVTLAEAKKEPAYRQRAGETIKAALSLMKRAPAAAPRMAVALMRYLGTDEGD